VSLMHLLRITVVLALILILIFGKNRTYLRDDLFSILEILFCVL